MVSRPLRFDQHGGSYVGGVSYQVVEARPDPPPDLGPDSPRSESGGEPMTSWALDNLLRHVRYQLDAWYGWQVLSLDDVVRKARADAAQRTQRAPDALELVSAEAVTWRDGSLGCPEPGKMYTMVLTDGVRGLERAGEGRGTVDENRLGLGIEGGGRWG